MPNFRKLEPSEIQTIENKGIGSRKQTEKLYDSILADYEVGDYGEAVLDEGENRLTIRNRLKAAATRRGIGLNFRRTQGDLIRFQVVEPDSIIGKIKSAIAKVPALISTAPAEPPAVMSSEPPAKPKGKGGRPRKGPAA
jgi:hypothetical protein